MLSTQSSPSSVTLSPIPTHIPLDSSPQKEHTPPKMNNDEKLNGQIAELQKAIEQTRHRLEVQEGQLNAFLMVKRWNSGEEERITVGAAALEGMEALGEFTKKQLGDWVRQKYPDLDFIDKSVDRPIALAMIDKKVGVLRENVGNKSQKIFKWGMPQETPTS